MIARLRALGWCCVLSLILSLTLMACGSGSPTATRPPDLEAVSALSAGETVGDLIPIGADYQPDTLGLFVQRALAYNPDDRVELRVLLPSFSSNALFQGPEDRQINLEDAQVRADQIQAVCEQLAAADLTCQTTVPDIQVRSDARDPDKVAEFGLDVDGVYGLGGDQVIAMQVIANTPLEATLLGLHQQGVPIAGNSAGAAIQSRNMIAGYTGNNFAWNGLQEGAVDLADGRDRRSNRGLMFGLDLAVIEQHALQRGRLFRSLQAVEQAPGPRIGIGPDWRTGVVIEDRHRITETVGLTSAYVLDEETWGAADSASYQGDRRSLSLHAVGFHLLPAGGYGYDLQNQRPMLNGSPVEPPTVGDRQFDFLARPAGAGPLLIAGDLLDDGPGVIEPVGRREALRRGSVLSHFIDLAREAGGEILLLAVGDDELTRSEARRLSQFLDRRRLTVQEATLTADSFLEDLYDQLAAADAIYILGTQQSTVADRVDELQALKLGELNEGGRILLFDDAAAAAVGEWMTSEDRPADDLEAKEEQASPPYLASYPFIVPGLGLIPGAAFEPRSFYDYRAGRSVAQIFHDPETVAFGVERETALELTPEGATVLGPAAILMLDGRWAPVLEAGTNDGIAAFWVLLDTFTTDQVVVAQ